MRENKYVIRLFKVFSFLCLICASSQVSANTVIFSDSFESGLGNWQNISVGDNKNWTRDSEGTSSSNTGPSTGANGSSYYVYLETSSGQAYESGDVAILESSSLSSSGIQLSFKYHMYGSNMGTLSVDILSAGSWINDIWSTSGQQHTGNNSAYTAATIDLSSYNVSKIRFRATAAGGYMGDMAIDDVVISAAPSGPVAPEFVSNPLIKSDARQDVNYNDTIAADASDANGDPILYSKISGPEWLIVAADGSLSGIPTINDIGVNSFIVEASDGSLSSTTTLNIDVKDASAPSLISSSDFEVDMGEWQNVSLGDNEDWSRDSNGTPSSNTGPSTGADGSNYYLYLETSSGEAYESGDVAILEGPAITSANVDLKFKYHMYGTDSGTLAVDILSGGNWINNVWTVSGQQQTSNSADYVQAEIDLSSYSVSKIRFRATAIGGYRGDMAIDDVEIWGAPLAPVAPVFNSNPLIKADARQLTSYNNTVAMDASDANGDPITFKKIDGPNWLTVAADGTLSGAPGINDIGDNSFIIEASDGSLTNTTTLVIDVKDASSPIVISSSDFESGLGDWHNVSTDNQDWSRDSAGTPSSSTGPATGADGSTYYIYLETSSGYAYNSGDVAILEGPVIASENLQLSFKYHMYGANTGTLAVDILSGGDWVSNVWTISGQQQSGSSAAYTTATVDLAQNTTKIRFRATAAGGYTGDIAIDDVVITSLFATNPTDSDNDGVIDTNDLCPNTPANETVNAEGCSASQIDTDGDGYLDINDDFPLDPTEWLDTDGDGTGNNADTDDDGDGYLDTNDDFPLDPTEWLDTDGDGTGNNADTDDDGDGYLDSNDDFPLDPTEWLDTDGDGIGNNADSDDDGDGYLDSNDDFPLDKNEWLDTDGDGTGNNADTDDDGDGYLDSNDDFPLDKNEWLDTDGDGIGDNADPDDDNDGMSDEFEETYGVDDPDQDADNDGLTNLEEYQLGTNPLLEDTDSDNLNDSVDNCPSISNPDQTDTDGDNHGDVCDVDNNNNGLIEIESFDDLSKITVNENTPSLYGINTGCLNDICIGYELLSDLDFDSNSDGVITAEDHEGKFWNNGKGWLPIQTLVGIFEGNGHSIRNLMINRDNDSSNVGLFAEINNAEVSDLKINGELTRMHGNLKAGAVAGEINNTSIKNIHVKAEVIGSTSAGGIVGQSNDSRIIDSSSISDVKGKNFVGGIAGKVIGFYVMPEEEQVSISRCFSSGLVSSEQYAHYIGGITGYVANGRIYQTYTTATVTLSAFPFGMSYIGGFVGSVSGESIIKNSFANANVNHSRGFLISYAGGFAGNIDNSSVTIRNNYSSSTINSEYANGFAKAVDNVDAGNNYWDVTKSAVSSSNLGSPLSTYQITCVTSPYILCSGESVMPFASWNGDIWYFGSSTDYPSLKIDSDGDGLYNGQEDINLNGIVDEGETDFLNPDSDGDGVLDGADQCPDTPEGDMVDQYGCPIEPDSDGDGVPDNEDAFPFDPYEWADTDNDGVGDNSDQCPDTPEGMGVDQFGCHDNSVDTDGDGLADDIDLDDDNDGMPDKWELANGLNRLMDDSSLDSDGDTVSNLNEYLAQTDPNNPNSKPGDDFISSLALGEYFSCAIVNGELRCWGQDVNIDGLEYLTINNKTQVDINSSAICVQTNGMIECLSGYAGNPLMEELNWNPIMDAASFTIAEHRDTGCAITVGGQLRCWGDDYNGLVSGSTITPVQQVDLFSGHACAHNGETLECWGDNSYGQTSIPEYISGKPVDIAVGDVHTCLLDDQHNVYCWGNNSAQQLNVPANLGNVISIEAGYAYTCALNDQGGVQCWGGNGYQINNIPQFTNQPTRIFSGPGNICALHEGRYTCWGANDFGQSAIWYNVKEYAVSANDVCAINDDKVMCFGYSSIMPFEVSMPQDIIMPQTIGAGRRHFCTWATNGMHCWGEDSPALDAPPYSLHNVTVIDGAETATCVIDNGQVSCWGDNANGLLNVNIPMMGPYHDLDISPQQGCVIRELASNRNEVLCWGSSFLPAMFSLVESKIAVGSAESNSGSSDVYVCMYDDNMGYRCNGWSGKGDTNPPYQLTEIAQLYGGYGRSCALHNNGDVECWGDNADPYAIEALNIGNVIKLEGYQNRICAQNESKIACTDMAGSALLLK